MSEQNKTLDWNLDWQEQVLDVKMVAERQPYFSMWEKQKEWVKQIDQKKRYHTLLLLEHEHVYTFGRGGHAENLLLSTEICREKGIEIAEIDRGGDVTYHGPGQLVGYPLIGLEPLHNDAHAFLRKIEATLINTLADFGIQAQRKNPYTGVWVDQEKVAAIGVKFNRGRESKRFITSHGFALNVHTDLSFFEDIIPCGIRDYGVTSMAKILGYAPQIKEVANVYQGHFLQEFHFDLHKANEPHR